MRAGADHGKHRARRARQAAAAADAAIAAFADAESVGAANHRSAGTQASRQARAPRGLTVTLQDQNAERLVPAMQRAAKLFAERLKDPRRARDANDRLIPDVAGDGIARADVIIEAIFENLDAKRGLFAALEKKAK